MSHALVSVIRPSSLVLYLGKLKLVSVVFFFVGGQIFGGNTILMCVLSRAW